MLRMLIVVKNDLPPEHVALTCAHGSLAGYLKWKDDPILLEWVNSSFRKVIRMASPTEFQQAKLHGEHIVMTESSLEGQETALVFRINEEYPKFLNYLRKYTYQPPIGTEATVAKEPPEVSHMVIPCPGPG